MPGKAYNELFELAADTYGYVTQQQAVNAGFTRQALHEMVRRGVARRVGWGLYRLIAMPATPLDQLMEAVLWMRPARAVISHETALDLYDVCDVNPAKLHLTVPRRFRTNRRIPQLYVVHHHDLADENVRVHEGIPVVTLRCAIEQCHTAGTRPDLLRAAMDQGHARGLLSVWERNQLRARLNASDG